MRLPDGSYYNGEWTEGEKNGNGIYHLANGDIYEGKWSHNKRNGFGKYIWSSGDIFSGEFDNDDIKKGEFVKMNGEIIKINMNRRVE